MRSIRLKFMFHRSKKTLVNIFKFKSCDQTPQVKRLRVNFSIHKNECLTLIIYGMDYKGIKSFLLPMLTRLDVSKFIDSCFHNWHSLIYLRIIPLHIKFYHLLNYSRNVFNLITKKLLVFSKKK